MKDFHFFYPCREILPKIRKHINNRRVVIWGAGNGGKICKHVLEEMDIKADFFVDSKILREDKDIFEGLKVRNYHVLDKEKYFCVIAVINPWTDIAMRLENMGYSHTDYCYISNMYDNINIFSESLMGSYKYRLAVNNRNIKFSVVIPVYNRENYLDECIESVLLQTYPVYEIILVDDGSKDLSGQICDNYASKYSFIKVIHQLNSGVSIARNKGIYESSGDYLFFLDSDDRMALNALESFYNIIIKYLDLDFVDGRVRRFKGKSLIIQDDPVLSNDNIRRLNGQEAFIVLYLNGCLPGGMHGVYRRGYLLGLNGLYIEHLNIGEDLELNIRIFANTNNLAINEMPVYEARKDTPGSLMKWNNIDSFFSNLKLYRILEKHLYNNYSADFISVLKRLIGERFVHYHFVNYIESASEEDCKQILDRREEYMHLFKYYSSSRYQFYIAWINELGFENATFKLKKYMKEIYVDN